LYIYYKKYKMYNAIQVMVFNLKYHKITLQLVERELGLSNGVIGRAAKGTLKLTEVNMFKLTQRYNQILDQLGVKEIQPPEKVPSLQKTLLDSIVNIPEGKRIAKKVFEDTIVTGSANIPMPKGLSINERIAWEESHKVENSHK